ncbi:7845_t:CDS:2 [Funneliformis mosseae]|uniref:7845_t:CDS:1 n=1 Tax=Funneliformis mosseae TaxID=27381 RepID=A0A9N8WNJ1_FUNMO|nr:7845_t:CDS:2 [Funneliformis mosseae]
MATFEKIEKELNDAKDRLNKAEEKLKEFEEGWKEKKIWELEKKLDDGEERNEEQRKVWERLRDELKEEKKELKTTKVKWKDQTIKSLDKLIEFNEEKERLSLEEYLSRTPPYFAYSPHSTTSKSSTIAVGIPPDEVKIWKDFFENAMNVNICIPLNRVNSSYEFTMRKVAGVGDPDFVCHKKDGDVLILAIEIKILKHIKPGQTLPELYKEDSKAKMVIQTTLQLLIRKRT